MFILVFDEEINATASQMKLENKMHMQKTKSQIKFN